MCAAWRSSRAQPWGAAAWEQSAYGVGVRYGAGYRTGGLGRGLHFCRWGGVQWEPQRDLSRGSLLSAVFKKAMAALAVRVPRQRVRNKG